MVYGVFGGCYSDWFVVGYFENKKDAEAYCNEHNDKCDDDWERCYYVKPLLNLVDNDPHIYRRYVYDGGNGCVWQDAGEFSDTKGETLVVDFGQNRAKRVYMWLRPYDFSKERVRKIAHDAIAKHKAQKEGIV